jgi:hypothetical protein
MRPTSSFLPSGHAPDDDQQALRGLLQASLYVDAVDPEVDVALGREIALAPARAPRGFSLRAAIVDTCIAGTIVDTCVAARLKTVSPALVLGS